MIYQVVSEFSFSGCLEMCPKSSIPLSELVKYPTRHPRCPIFASFKIMPRMSTILHLHVAYDNNTRQLANDNDNYQCMSMLCIAGVCS